MGVYKDSRPTKDGKIWFFKTQYEDFDGTKKPKKSGRYATKKEAERLAAEYKAAIGRGLDPFAGTKTVKDLLDNLLAETQYSDIVTNEIWQHDDGTNLLRVLFYSIPALLALWGHRYVEQADSPLVNACVNCSICTAMIYLLSAFSSGIYVGRLPIYTTLQGYAVVPWLLKNMFTKESEAMVRVGLIGGFLMFFYYQMHVTWGIL